MRSRHRVPLLYGGLGIMFMGPAAWQRTAGLGRRDDCHRAPPRRRVCVFDPTQTPPRFVHAELSSDRLRGADEFVCQPVRLM
jgi:hypothetical protein